MLTFTAAEWGCSALNSEYLFDIWISHQESVSNVGASGVNSESSDEESSERDQLSLSQHEVLCVLCACSFIET